MHRLGLAARLMLTVGLLATVIVTAASVSIGFLVYLQAEQQIKSQLISASGEIITGFLMSENGHISLQQRDDGQSLVVLLRNLDVGLYLADADGAPLARYGIYRNIGNTTSETLFLSVDRSILNRSAKGIYADRNLSGVGRIDTYTAALRSGSNVVGYLQVSRINTIIPIVTRSLVYALFMLIPGIWIASVSVIRWGTRYTLAPLSQLVTIVETLDIDTLPDRIQMPSTMDHDVLILSQTISSLIGRIRAFITRQGELAQNLSHEFKTPLTRINTRLQSLFRHASTEQQMIINQLMREVVSLGEQVDSLLDVSLYETSQVKSGRASWRFSPFINEISRNLPGPIRLKSDFPESFSLEIPKGHARTIWRNILENAAKYGTKNGTIHVSAQEDAYMWSVSVSNATIHEKANPSLVFLRKYRGFVRNSVQGYGIGMAIVRDTCKQLGLTVRYDTDKSQRVYVEVRGTKPRPAAVTAVA